MADGILFESELNDYDLDRMLYNGMSEVSTVSLDAQTMSGHLLYVDIQSRGANGTLEVIWYRAAVRSCHLGSCAHSLPM